jgi:hypothetical protein
MASLEHELEHPKKRRRREILRMPLSARLAFDDTVQGNAAIVPRSLWTSLAGTELGTK